MGNAFDFFPQDAQGRYTPGGPIGALNYGDMVTFAVAAGAVPNAPTGLDAIADLVDINLDWDAQGTADSFSVFRNGSSIATGVILSEFTDLAVAIGEFFSYTVTAVNVNGSSAASTPSIVLSNDIPSIVTGAGTMPINGVAVLVEWDDPVADRGVGSPSTGLTVEYLVFRNDTGDANPFVFVGTVPEGINFLNDTTVLGGHSYSYKILSSNEIGNATANSTVTAPVMVDNALVIRALEADGIDSLEEDAEITIFNSTFNSGPLQANAQGRVFLFNASGAYNFTILYTAQNIDFLVNKTLTGVSGVILTEDTVVNVNTNVFKVDCASNGPAKDFKILVNSTSNDHFISDFTTPVCDVDDKVSWQVQYEGLGGGGGGSPSTSDTKVAMISQTFENSQPEDVEGNCSGNVCYVGNLLTAGQAIYPNSFKVTGVIAHFTADGTPTNGTMNAVVLSNVTEFASFGTEIVEATSDSLDLTILPTSIANPTFPLTSSLKQITTNDRYESILFNFTNPPTLNDATGMFFGFKIDGLATPTKFDFDAFANTNQDGGGTCFINDDSTNAWEECATAGAIGIEVQILVENVPDFETTGGANSSALVGHYTFDSNTLFDSAFDDTLFVNAGTFGHDLDISVLDADKHQDSKNNFAPITGKVGDGAILIGGPTELILGTSEFDSTLQYSFLHNEFPHTPPQLPGQAVDKLSVNFWVNGNWTGLSEAFVPILDDYNSGSFKQDGIIIGIDINGEIFFHQEADIDVAFNRVRSTLGGISDNTWNMITVVVDQDPTVPNTQLTMCQNATCQTVNQTSSFDRHNFMGNRLMIGNAVLMDNFSGLPVDDGEALQFKFDQLCIWKDHKLSGSEITTLYNSGSGTTCGTVSQSTTGGGSNSSFTTTMATQVLSLGDFGNNAKNFVVNGTMFNTTFSSPVITSEDIVVSTNSSDVLLVFEELFLQEAPFVPQPGGPPSPTPTQSSGGGGIPRLDVTTQLQFFEDLFGFSLFSKIHQLQVGQTQDGTIDITWNSPSPITITGIQVGDQFITWIGFPKTPFVIEGNDRISTGKIPYRIMPPNNLCDEVTGQTANCVDRILYEIPVKIFAAVEGQPIEANTVIKLNLSLDITLALFTVFIAFVGGVGAIIYRAAIINPRHRRASRKELKTRSKDSNRLRTGFQPENQNSVEDHSIPHVIMG